MRAPFQVLLFPYIKEGDEYLYAIFKRADFGFWQGLSGGGEDAETPDGAVRREAYEEAGIDRGSSYIRLSSMTTIPAEYVGGKKWGEDIVMIPECAFGLEMTSKVLNISNEHSEYSWVSFKDAIKMLKYDSNKSAVWELHHRLTHGFAGVSHNRELVGRTYSST